MSNTKRLVSEISAIELESCRIIEPSSLYVVKIAFDNMLSPGEIKRLATDELYSDPQPVSIYFNDAEIVLIFSYVTENYYLPGGCEIFNHQLSGNHHHIVSKYASKFSRILPQSKIIVSIVEFQTQIQAIAYMGWVVYNTSQNTFISLSNGKINEDLLQFRTHLELKDILYDKCGVKWDTLDNHVRYGTFLKLKRRKGKIVIKELSENFDARETKRYTNFIFG